MAPRTILVGLLLALHYRGTACIDDASELLHQSLSARSRALLEVHDIDDSDDCQTRAAYARCTRGLDAITTAFDPHRHDRRKRLPRTQTAEVENTWESQDAAQTVEQLSELANRLIHASVHLASSKGMLRHWPGDIGVDDTPAWSGAGRPPAAAARWTSAPATTRKAGRRTSTGPTRSCSPSPGTATRTPLAATHSCAWACRSTVRTGPSAARPSKCSKPSKASPSPNASSPTTAPSPTAAPKTSRPPHEQQATNSYWTMRSTPSAAKAKPTVRFGEADSSTAPPRPEHLIEAGRLLRKHASDEEIAAGRGLILEAEKYRFQTKEARRPDASWRAQCPASGTSPTVTCPRLEARAKPRRAASRAVDLSNPRARTAHPAAKHRVQPQNTPPTQWPKCCTQNTITVLAEDNARYAQPLAHGTPQWETVYKSIGRRPRAATAG